MQILKLLIVEVSENHVVNENVHEGTDRQEDQEDPQGPDHRGITHFVGKDKQAADQQHEVGHHCCENVELSQSHHAKENHKWQCGILFNYSDNDSHNFWDLSCFVQAESGVFVLNELDNCVGGEYDKSDCEQRS